MPTKEKETPKPPPSRVEIFLLMLADALFSTYTGEPVNVVRERVLMHASDEERAAIEQMISAGRQHYASLD